MIFWPIVFITVLVVTFIGVYIRSYNTHEIDPLNLVRFDLKQLQNQINDLKKTQETTVVKMWVVKLHFKNAYQRNDYVEYRCFKDEKRAKLEVAKSVMFVGQYTKVTADLHYVDCYQYTSKVNYSPVNPL